ncbi:COP9 signalosome complex subunit 5 [[Candida] railenensis]|uniref:COP9 signalosome complex subunit 5 n=1 Tax=[Candida] railenensis TaxID=45579 RepID=A0A9P0QRI2_9ASCO|nr:COP9 signalosome complex subunit 5 [[Candida] railenensis]
MEVHTLAEYIVGNDGDRTSDKNLSNEAFADKLYKIDSDPKIMKERPWKKDAKYFKKVYISSLALIKMTLHATSGGSIEIMGMMTGKITEGSIVVMDVYPLPVEGTETRVNAQAEGYEYMVQYLEQSKRVGRNEHIVGWYHSHPGYGCWLSGIDVATQSLNQNFQDPYLAIVVDPLKTKSQGIVDIGAFRTYPENNRNKTRNEGKLDNRKLPKEKRQDFGAHYEDYYSLDVEIFKSKNDRKIIDLLLKKSWRSGLLSISESGREGDESVTKVNEMIEKSRGNLASHQLHVIENTLLKKFERNYEDEMREKLLKNRGNSSIWFNVEDTNEDEDEELSDESDLEVEQDDSATLDVSDIDVDDAMSMDSTNVGPRNKRNDSDIEDDDLDGEHTPQSSSASGSLGAESDFPKSMRLRKIQRRKIGIKYEMGGSRGQLLRKHQHYQQQIKQQNVSRRSQRDLEQNLQGSPSENLSYPQSVRGEHELKDARSRACNEIQALGNQVGLSSIEYLLTLRAQQKIFGADK